MKRTIDVYRDPVPVHVRDRIEELEAENEALRMPRERLLLEGVTVGAFATGLTAWMAAAGVEQLGLVAVGIWCVVGGVWGVFRLTNQQRTF